MENKLKLSLNKKIIVDLNVEDVADVNGGVGVLSTYLFCNGLHCGWTKPTNGGPAPEPTRGPIIGTPQTTLCVDPDYCTPSGQSAGHAYTINRGGNGVTDRVHVGINAVNRVKAQVRSRNCFDSEGNINVLLTKARF